MFVSSLPCVWEEISPEPFIEAYVFTSTHGPTMLCDLARLRDPAEPCRTIRHDSSKTQVCSGVWIAHDLMSNGNSLQLNSQQTDPGLLLFCKTSLYTIRGLSLTGRGLGLSSHVFFFEFYTAALRCPLLLLYMRVLRLPYFSRLGSRQSICSKTGAACGMVRGGFKEVLQGCRMSVTGLHDC